MLAQKKGTCFGGAAGKTEEAETRASSCRSIFAGRKAPRWKGRFPPNPGKKRTKKICRASSRAFGGGRAGHRRPAVGPIPSQQKQDRNEREGAENGGVQSRTKVSGDSRKKEAGTWSVRRNRFPGYKIDHDFHHRTPKWLTREFLQDWYGLVPLLVGLACRFSDRAWSSAVARPHPFWAFSPQFT